MSSNECFIFKFSGEHDVKAGICLWRLCLFGFSVSWGKEELNGNMTTMVTYIPTQFSKDKTPFKNTQGARNSHVFQGNVNEMSITSKISYSAGIQRVCLWRKPEMNKSFVQMVQCYAAFYVCIQVTMFTKIRNTF